MHLFDYGFQCIIASWKTDQAFPGCRFVFDDEALEVVIGKQQKESENAFVGGQNRWSYDSFVNWEFWFPNFPILVYFKVRAASTMSVCGFCLFN